MKRLCAQRLVAYYFCPFSFTDDGIGIPAEQLNSIFEAYFQLGKQSADAKPGLGLGLALCKALVELHGGRIEARSEGIGKGSEFTISLPIGTGAPSFVSRSTHDQLCPMSPSA